MMEQVGHYIFADKGCEALIRYEYRIRDFGVEICLYGCDLANVLEITGNATLNDMGFEVSIETLKNDGMIEEQTVILPDIILNSTANEFRNNSSLYENPYYINSN